MANDKNGSELFVGDEVVLRAKITHLQGEHALTRTPFPIDREFWFPGSYLERTAQGAESVEADRKAAAPAVVVVPGPTPAGGAAGMLTEAEAPAPSKREQAIAFVMTKTYRDTERTYTREEAESVVDEYGYGHILDDRDEEDRQAIEVKAKVAAYTKTAGSPMVPTAQATPAPGANTSEAPSSATGSASAQPAAGTSPNEAKKEADGAATPGTGAA